jgi:hypothetical protein
MSLKISILEVTKPCSKMKLNRRFSGTYRRHPQDRTVSQRRNQPEAGSKLGLLFDSENWDDVFLWNVGWLSPDYRALCPRRHHCEYLKSRAPKFTLFAQKSSSWFDRNSSDSTYSTSSFTRIVRWSVTKLTVACAGMLGLCCVTRRCNMQRLIFMIGHNSTEPPPHN